MREPLQQRAVGSTASLRGDCQTLRNDAVCRPSAAAAARKSHARRIACVCQKMGVRVERASMQFAR
eukprot:5158476-Lingulodinium_polyedra.AAC.1